MTDILFQFPADLIITFSDNSEYSILPISMEQNIYKSAEIARGSKNVYSFITNTIPLELLHKLQTEQSIKQVNILDCFKGVDGNIDNNHIIDWPDFTLTRKYDTTKNNQWEIKIVDYL